MSTRANSFVETVRRTLHDHRMVAPGETVLVAVSGGADSMALLHALHDLHIPLEVAHLDHGTRDGASAEDAAFVMAAAHALGVPCHVSRRDVPREAAEAGRTFEDYARDVRYAFLVATAKNRRCAAVATAHHADDQAETVLMRVIRGTSLRGLAAIPPVRRAEDVRIVRPLMALSRDQILAWCAERNIAYRHDRSNDDTRHLRNRVRHDLLPRLESDYNPRIKEALVRLAATLRIEDELLSELASALRRSCCPDGMRIHRSTFAASHRALQRRVLSAIAAEHGYECPFDRIESAAQFIGSSAPGRTFELGGGLRLVNGRDATHILAGPETFEPLEVSLEAPGETVAFGRVFRATPAHSLPPVPLEAYCSPRRQVFDARRVRPPLALRRRRPGDRFRPLGMAGSRKLQDYFTDLRLSVYERDRQVLLTAEGRIVWVVGHAMDAIGAVSETTQEVLEIEVFDMEEGQNPNASE